MVLPVTRGGGGHGRGECKGGCGAGRGLLADSKRITCGEGGGEGCERTPREGSRWVSVYVGVGSHVRQTKTPRRQTHTACQSDPSVRHTTVLTLALTGLPCFVVVAPAQRSTLNARLACPPPHNTHRPLTRIALTAP